MKLVLKGLGASPGRVKARVKIVHTPKEMDKLKKGEILVTEMTNPLFVPAMEKASGIITDFGGMLSHAAIVSREMGVPCVVGTEKATKVLKDGQLVLLDGSTGEVFVID